MTITTWSSFSKRRNSTKQPTGGTTKTVRLKNPTSIINPVFLIQSFNLADNYLQWGSRYYFIDDIIIVNNDMAEYHCSVDALASWKTSIGGMMEYVARSASDYDERVMDMLYPVKAGVSTTIVSTDATGSSEVTVNDGCFVIGVVGPGASQTGGIKYYYMSPGQFEDLTNYMFGTSSDCLDQSETDIVIATQKQLVNPYQYITSARFFPFTRPYEYDDAVYFGWWESDLSAHPISAQERLTRISGSITMPSHPDASTRGRYLNGSPFTTRDLYIWGFGQIVLDPSDFCMNEDLQYSIDIDLYEGSAVMNLKAGNTRNIGKYFTTFGIPVNLGQIQQDIVGAGMSSLGAVVSAAMGNFLGSASAVGSAAESLYPRVTTNGNVGTIGGFTPADPTVVSRFMTQTPMDVTQNGRPLCAPRTINTLSGYIKTENADVDLPCTQEERDQIAAYMDGGFFYE